MILLKYFPFQLRLSGIRTYPARERPHYKQPLRHARLPSSVCNDCRLEVSPDRLTMPTKYIANSSHYKDVLSLVKDVNDCKEVYIGSANLTGAGIGMKGETTRNFEAGILTDDPIIVEEAMEQFDNVWNGSMCKKCRRKQYCADPISNL